MKRIFILSQQAMFGQGVAGLIGRSPDMAIVGRESDPDRMLTRLNELHPDVTVIDTTDPACSSSLLVMRILEEGLCSKVIGLNIHDNIIHIYCGEQRVASEVSDLLTAIG